VVLVAVFAPLGARITDVTSEDIALPAGSQSKQVQKTLRERFPGGDTRTAVLVYSHAGGLTQKDREAIRDDAERAERVPLVGRPIAPFDPAPVSGQVSAQGDVAFTIVPIVATGHYHIGPTIDALRRLGDGHPQLETHVTGDAALLSDVLAAVRKSDKTLLLVTGSLVLVLLIAVYRAPLLALVPLLTVGVAYSVASGIVYLLARAGAIEVDSTAVSLLLVLMFGAGTDYCLLLVSRYRAALRTTEDKNDALRVAVERVGPAILVSGATVALALLTMLVATLGLNHTLGPVNAIGITVVMVASLTLLPAILTLLGRRGFWPTSHTVSYGARRPRDVNPEQGLWGRIGAAVRARPVAALTAAVVLLAAGAVGGFAYHASVDPTAQFRKRPDSKQGARVLLSRFPAGSLAPTTVLVERGNGRVSEADVARTRDRIASIDGVAAVRDTGRRSRDQRIAALSVAFRDDPYGGAALRRVTLLRDRVADVRSNVTAVVGDGSAARLDYRVSARRDLKVFGPLVLAVVLLMLVVLLRALVAPLYLLASVVLSFLAGFGLSMLVFRYLFGQTGFDPEVPVIVFIFLVALGSDYTIFLMSSVREETAGRGMRDGVLRALTLTGPVITSAGLILAGTFATLTVLPVWLLFEIGFAVAVGVLLDTFVVRSLLVPALAWTFGERSWWPARGAVASELPAEAR
jgi:putative drug exporter of the RND superfamily